MKSATIVTLLLASLLVWGCATSTRRSYSPGGIPVTTRTEVGDTVWTGHGVADPKSLSHAVANADTIALAAGRARIFVIRQSDSQVLLNYGAGDGTIVRGVVAPEACLFWDHAAGPITVRTSLGVLASLDRSGLYSFDKPNADVSINLEAGKSYFVITHGGFTWSWTGDNFGIEASEVDAATGRKLLGGCSEIRQSKLF